MLRFQKVQKKKLAKKSFKNLFLRENPQKKFKN